MKRKNSRKKRPSSKSRQLFFFTFRKTLIISLFLLVISALLLFTQTHTWYFLTTSKEKVDFANTDGKYDPSDTIAYFGNQMIPVPQIYKYADLPKAVLGESTGEKRIEVDLTNQRLYAFEDGRKVFDFAISSGLPWYATPPGEYWIWTKFRYTRMRGGSQELGTYYDLPNVPFTMFFYNDKQSKWKGYALHGAYWHNDFGHPRSHGCVNMRIDEAEQIYYWALPALGDRSSIQATDDNPGTRIVIYGTTPR